MKIKEIKCKSVLNKSNLPEVNYCINPYIGCQHACVYCYARFMRRFTGHAGENWGKFVDVKINAPEMLEQELSRNPKKGAVLIGSVCDAYQPIERKYKLTRQILEILLKYDFPVAILTKSDLIIRDIDLLKQFSDCEAGLTITTLDNKIAGDFEPLASAPQRRLIALEELHKNKIKTYCFIGPILPDLTDLEKIFSAIKNKVNFVMAESLNMKCGNWQYLQEVLKNKYSNLLPEYQKRFSQAYWQKTKKTLKQLSEKYNISLKGFYQH
ncbi:MAG: radical SAM protein [bacterium]